MTLVDRLERLAHKYRELIRLRERREELQATGAAGFEQAEMDARGLVFRVVAAEFPGALRELETTTAGVMRRRLVAIEAELEQLRAAPERERPKAPWIAIMLDYHAVLRELIAVKTWFAKAAGRGEVTPAQHAEFQRWYDEWPHRTGLVDLGEHLATLRRPVRGRIVPLALSLLAERHGMEATGVTALLFGRNSEQQIEED